MLNLPHDGTVIEMVDCLCSDGRDVQMFQCSICTDIAMHNDMCVFMFMYVHLCVHVMFMLTGSSIN